MSYCCNIENISPLKDLINLKYLMLYNCRNIKDLTPLTKLFKSYNLDINGYSVLEQPDLLCNI